MTAETPGGGGLTTDPTLLGAIINWAGDDAELDVCRELAAALTPVVAARVAAAAVQARAEVVARVEALRDECERDNLQLVHWLPGDQVYSRTATFVLDELLDSVDTGPLDRMLAVAWDEGAYAERGGEDTINGNPYRALAGPDPRGGAEGGGGV